MIHDRRYFERFFGHTVRDYLLENSTLNTISVIIKRHYIPSQNILIYHADHVSSYLNLNQLKLIASDGSNSPTWLNKTIDMMGFRNEKWSFSDDLMIYQDIMDMDTLLGLNDGKLLI